MNDNQCSTCINVCHAALTIHPESRHSKTSIFSFSSCSMVIPPYAYILFGDVSNVDTARLFLCLKFAHKQEKVLWNTL